MRLSDLLHAEVRDADGNSLGSVDDVRIVQDGPLLLPFGAAFRIEGLMVGHRSMGTRLGYVRGGTKGPWLLRVIFSALEHQAHYIPWDDVVTWDGSTVQISKHRGELEAVMPLS